jgi:hypothetical protein
MGSGKKCAAGLEIHYPGGDLFPNWVKQSQLLDEAMAMPRRYDSSFY